MPFALDWQMRNEMNGLPPSWESLVFPILSSGLRHTGGKLTWPASALLCMLLPHLPWTSRSGKRTTESTRIVAAVGGGVPPPGSPLSCLTLSLHAVTNFFFWVRVENHKERLSCLKSHCEWSLEAWGSAGPGSLKGLRVYQSGSEGLTPPSG